MVLVNCSGGGDKDEFNSEATVNGTVSPQNGYNVYGGNKEIAGPISAFKSYTLIGQGTGTGTYTGSYEYYLIGNDGEGSIAIEIDAVMGSNNEYYPTGITSNTSNYQNLDGAPDNQYLTITEQGYILIDASNDNLTDITIYAK